jgi:hypothetical protein
MSPVFVDGRTAGVTPIVVSGVPPGSHTIVISRPGYADYRANVTLSAGGRREVSAVLQPLNATPPGTSPGVTSETASRGRLALPPLVPLGAIILAILGFRRRS